MVSSTDVTAHLVGIDRPAIDTDGGASVACRLP